MHCLLRTERLTLRPCGMGDLDVVYQLWTDADIRRFLFDDREISLEEAEFLIQDSESRFTESRYGIWLFCDRTHPDLVAGFAGLLYSSSGIPSLIFGTHPHCWGRGYAREAASEVLTYALGSLGLRRVVADVDPPNGASIRVLEALGMTRYEPEHEDGLLHYELQSWDPEAMSIASRTDSPH